MKYYYLATLVLFAFSCKKNKDESSAVLMPLKMGNSWTYTNIFYQEDGTADTASDKWVITAKKDYEGHEYFQGGNDLYFGLVSPNQVDVWTPSFERPYFKKVNKEEVVFSEQSLYQGCMELYIHTAYPEEVTYKGYKCFKNVEVSSDCNGIAREETIYFASGIGLIGSQRKTRSFQTGIVYLQLESVLKEYSLN